MTEYMCANGHKFVHSAKQTLYEFNFNPQLVPTSEFMHPGDFTVTKQTTIDVCPYCQIIEFNEVDEPTVEVESVYVYDLGSGAQTELDKLLAQGYKIVNRYSKQYHLEKPKNPHELIGICQRCGKTANLIFSQGSHCKECFDKILLESFGEMNSSETPKAETKPQ